MWLGDQITDKGIGNGISLLIFVNIISRFPTTFIKIAGLQKAETVNFVEVIIFSSSCSSIIYSSCYYEFMQKEEFLYSMQEKLLVEKCIKDNQLIFLLM